MTTCSHITWRVIVVLAFAGTAALAVTFVPITLPACSKRGPKFLSVQAIQPRPGIPGFALP